MIHFYPRGLKAHARTVDQAEEAAIHAGF